MHRLSIILVVLSFAIAVSAADSQAPTTTPVPPTTTPKPAQTPTTNKAAGVILAINATARTFQLEVATEKDGATTKNILNCIWHAVKDKYFVELAIGDRIEITWYNSIQTGPIAAFAKVLEKTKTAPTKPADPVK
ncbi:MAG: hypothetical protein AAB263_19740 [Planctomycetota bacterium]